MLRLKVLDKDETKKANIEKLDWPIQFSVSESGYWSLDFTYAGDEDIQIWDLVQVIDEDLATNNTTVIDNTHLILDWVNDYITTGSREVKTYIRPSLAWECSVSGADDIYSYVKGFSETDTAWILSYIDVWGLFEEIGIDRSFSMKFAFRTWAISATWYIFMHNDFSIHVTWTTVRVWFSGWDTVSFTTAINTYYRCVLTYNGTNFTLYYNSVLAVGTATPSYNTSEIYCTIGNYIQDYRFYTMFIRSRELTAWEVTSENASHTIVTTTDTILNYNANVSQPLAIHTTRDWDLWFTWTENVVFSWRFKLWSDGTASLDSQPIATLPYARLYCYWTTNIVRLQYDGADTVKTEHTLWTWDRGRHYYRCVVEKIGANRVSRLVIDSNTELVTTTTTAPTTQYITQARLGEYNSSYFDWDIKSFYLATISEAYNTQDNTLLQVWSPIWYTAHSDILLWDFNEWSWDILSTTWIIVGATRTQDNSAPLVKQNLTLTEYPIYFWQVSNITPSISHTQGKRNSVSCIGIQTTFSEKYYRLSNGLLSWSELIDTDQIIQNVLDQSYHYLDYTGTQLIPTQDYTRWSTRTRENLTITTATTTTPFWWVAYQLQKLWWWVDDIIIKQTLVWVSLNVPYIYRFWIRSSSIVTTRTLSIDYSNDGWLVYFNQKNLTINWERQRVWVIASRSSWSSSISFRIRVSGNFYISDFDLYKQSDSTLHTLWWFPMDISYSNTKGIQAFQDAITYSWSKVKRWTQYLEFFEWDTNNTPDHYLIEQKHLESVEKWIYGDEIFNSVAMKYSSGTTSFIQDTTSIDTYRKREVVIWASNINSLETAEWYAGVYLQTSKDPKEYVKFKVVKSYPIGSLKVWDLVQINGNSLWVRRWYISRIDMSEHSAIVYLDNYNSLNKSLSFLR